MLVRQLQLSGTVITAENISFVLPRLYTEQNDHVGWSFDGLFCECNVGLIDEVGVASVLSFKMSILGESALLSDKQSLSSCSFSCESFSRCDEEGSSTNFDWDDVDGASLSRLAASSSLFVFLHLARRFLNQTLKILFGKLITH